VRSKKIQKKEVEKVKADVVVKMVKILYIDDDIRYTKHKST
jgi:hypothetical protein